MDLKMKKPKSNQSDKLGRLPQKTDYKKPRIINIFEYVNINHKKFSISNQFNQTKISEIEHLKNNGLMYSNIMKFK